MNAAGGTYPRVQWHGVRIYFIEHMFGDDLGITSFLCCTMQGHLKDHLPGRKYEGSSFALQNRG